VGLAVAMKFKASNAVVHLHGGSADSRLVKCPLGNFLMNKQVYLQLVFISYKSCVYTCIYQIHVFVTEVFFLCRKEYIPRAARSQSIDINTRSKPIIESDPV
jgi:hypothetical protein